MASFKGIKQEKEERNQGPEGRFRQFADTSAFRGGREADAV
jgi:hypothetical protein